MGSLSLLSKEWGGGGGQKLRLLNMGLKDGVLLLHISEWSWKLGFPNDGAY